MKQEANVSDADVQRQSSTDSESAMVNALAAYKRYVESAEDLTFFCLVSGFSFVILLYFSYMPCNMNSFMSLINWLTMTDQ